MSLERKPTRILQFDPFEADLHTSELRRGGVRINLPQQPFHILRLLLQRPGELVTREELRSAVWPADTFVDFDTGLNKSIKKLRDALGDSADRPRFVETLPKRGYRFIAPVTGVDGTTRRMETSVGAIMSRRSWKIVATAAVMLAAGIVGGLLWRAQQAQRLTDKDTIVLADLTNTTGDPVFDGTLKQGLTVQLEQSPFLSLMSEQRIQQTLRLMEQQPDARLTPEIARELRQRAGSAAVLYGSISSLGSQYVLGIKALNCHTGDTLAEEQERATDKERVLAAMDTAAAKLRRKLGESLSTIQKFDTPLEQATTPSLEALQAFSLGVKTMMLSEDFAASVPLFQRAIGLDSNFATAHVELALSYANLGESSLAAEHCRKAYELRERVSEREKLRIESTYYQFVTGDLEKARQVYEFWTQIYPRDSAPHGIGGGVYDSLGQFDRALAESLETLRLMPNTGIVYEDLVSHYLFLNRLREARSTAEEAQRKGLDSPGLRFDLYELAFLQNDAAGMAEQVAWSVGKPGVEDVLLVNEADTAAYFGRLGRAREFSRRACASAEHAEKKEKVAIYEADAALREALLGNATEALKRAAAALAVSTGHDVQYGAALALAVAGDATTAQALADDLSKRFPEDTVVQFNYLPTIRAAIALAQKSPPKAIADLQAASTYELGTPAATV
jgi:DNA-binding winged helix-turn-helix (wHTH) protein/tetratricopeptide (TPR) repeat protein